MANRQKADAELNIYEKLAKIRKAVEVIQKNKSGYGYNYVSEDEILARITGYMDRYALSLIPGIVPGTMQVTQYNYKKTKIKGDKVFEEQANEILVQADTTWTWVNNANPAEQVVVPWALVGQQADASQAFGSGLTYSDRYFLLKYFNVATPDEDPDAFRSKQQAAAEEESRAVAAELVSQIDVVVRGYMASHPDAAEAVGDFMKAYAKNGNYLKITDPEMAASLLSEFKKKFQEES